ncbi:hypothetical protein [Janibacter sp. YB324]|uniref:hypothetical protein n=1 Tax=Janibacter sp. YB324 TaxID=2761047 RepID=UPI00162A43ED|nr:hypothetical protein [Janibacter sp. YB324]QNF95568.1 hypothetical protein H7A72_07490 [Janibacter sp. YB324]
MTLNTDAVPLGERAWQGILDHVVAVGDAAETTYLEAKSTLDLTSKAGTAKVAKFLLGAANRLPHEAIRHFHGYAVLVIGAEAGTARGVRRGLEAHELEDRLRPYLGSQFPPFEFGRLNVDAEHEVLFIIAQPPQDGQPPFPCHKTYQGDDRRDNLEDGAVYVRGASNTRPARSGDLLALVQRAKGGAKPPLDLDVQIVGPVNRVDRVEEVLEILYDGEDERFRRQLTGRPASPLAFQPLAFGRQPLSPEERAERLAAWRLDRGSNIARGREYLLGVGLAGSGIRVTSHGRYVARPQIVLTFHRCEAFDFRDAEDAVLDKVLEPVVRARDPFSGAARLDALRLRPHAYPVAWENITEDVEVVLSPASLRPDTPWSTQGDDYVVVARDLEASTVAVTWTLTEEDSDVVTRGEIAVPTRAVVMASDLLFQVFPVDAGDGDGGSAK